MEIADVMRRSGGRAEVCAVPEGYGVAGPAPAAAVVVCDASAVAALVDLARTRGWALVPRGGGSQDGFGAAVSREPVVVVDTRGLVGIVSHTPGDLTARVRAGTLVADLDAQLQPHGQCLGSSSPSAAATVGGVVAGDDFGPARLAYGSARDWVLGLSVLDGAGRTFVTGGNVVKNVSGLDVGKLFVGGFGSLGLLTEVAVRLRPVPLRRCIWAASFDAASAAWAVVRAVWTGAFQPAGLVLTGADRGAVRLAVRLEGTAADVDAQLAGLTDLAAAAPVLDASSAGLAWAVGCGAGRSGAALAVRSEVPEGALAELHAAAVGWPGQPDRTAWPGLGVLWSVWPEGRAVDASLLDAARAARAATEAAGGRAVVTACPPTVRAEMDVFGDPGPLREAFRWVKRHFDPHGIFVPGRFAGGL